MDFAEMFDRLPRSPIISGRTILGLAGPPGAGKSTIAEAIVSHVGPTAVVVPMDGFHLANSELRRLGLSEVKGAPQTFDAAGYADLLTRLRDRAKTIYAPAFDRQLDEPVAGSIRITPDIDLVVTEGNYLLHSDQGWLGVRSCLDAVWWVDVPDSARIPRLIDRHVSHGKSPREAELWVNRSDEHNARAIRSDRAKADFVLHYS